MGCGTKKVENHWSKRSDYIHVRCKLLIDHWNLSLILNFSHENFHYRFNKQLFPTNNHLITAHCAKNKQTGAKK